MDKRSLIVGLSSGIILTFVMSMSWTQFFAVADQHGEIISKEKTIHVSFDSENPEGNVDLKKIVEEELTRPEECNQEMVFCQIETVGFDITIKKEWLRIDIRELNNQEFATSVPRIENDIDNLTNAEIVVMQELLARRGLLQYLDGSIVQERGFFGPLTWLALTKLGHIKGLSDEDPEFGRLLMEEINKLLDRMANDDNYVNNWPLPSETDMIPEVGDDLYDLWSYQHYLGVLAEDADRVDAGDIPLEINDDVNIDGFLNVERVEQ